ncbi:MAG TPA: hypothetical protein VFU77_05125 [Steroidobacteraceae bacterium]|nr:hypothetical protein [Steroidobacteraceae bacterium]
MQPDQTFVGQGLYVWTGASGRKYRYSAFMFGTHFGPGAANFIFAREVKRGQYAPLYVGQTPDLSEPFRNEAALQCITEGRATHVHVRFAGEDEAARVAECEDLVASLKPPCNASP